MAAPPKPWESPGVNRLQGSLGVPTNNMSGAGTLPPCCSGQSSTTSRAPPPLPNRPTQQGMYGSRMSSYGGGYGGGYGAGYGSSPYSSFGGGMYGSPYSSYGAYGGGMGYGRPGMNGQDEYNGFARRAEENSRQAFESVESIVNAFTSVSMMLDSTFQAVYNSFRAVVGVADNFSRLKMQLGQVFSAFAVFRLIRYLYRKLLVLLRLKPSGYAEEAWTLATDTVEQLTAEAVTKDSKKASWPILVFFGIILGAPWLIWRFISRMTDPTAENHWATGEDDHFVARAEFDFKSESTNELSFTAGQNINVAPKELQPRMKGWLLASVDGKKTGVIPANYVKVLGKKRGTRHMQEAILDNSIPPMNPAAIPQSASQQEEPCCHGDNAQSFVQSIPDEGSLDAVFQGGDNQENVPNNDLNISNEDSPVSNMDAEDILGENANNLE